MLDREIKPDNTEITKNMSRITSELNTDSDFGVGVITGNQQIESDDWWKKICLCEGNIIVCCSCGGRGGGASQMEKVD